MFTNLTQALDAAADLDTLTRLQSLLRAAEGRARRGRDLVEAERIAELRLRVERRIAARRSALFGYRSQGGST